jgi:hypothetical protein
MRGPAAVLANNAAMLRLVHADPDCCLRSDVCRRGRMSSVSSALVWADAPPTRPRPPPIPRRCGAATAAGTRRQTLQAGLPS